MKVAPGLLDRLFLTGEIAGSASPLLYRTDDGAQSWTTLPTASFETAGVTRIAIAGVSPTDPDLVFVTARRDDRGILFRSADGGASWTEVLALDDTIRAFTVRADGTTAIAGSVLGGVRISSDAGLTWTTPTQQPEMACLGERSDGDLFACGSNWGPDFFRIGRSSDGHSWTRVARFSDIRGPLTCPAGTPTHDICAVDKWEGLCNTLQLPVCATNDSPDAGTVVDPEPPGGCCNNSGPAPSVLLALLFLPILRRCRAA